MKNETVIKEIFVTEDDIRLIINLPLDLGILDRLRFLFRSLDVLLRTILHIPDIWIRIRNRRPVGYEFNYYDLYEGLSIAWSYFSLALSRRRDYVLWVRT